MAVVELNVVERGTDRVLVTRRVESESDTVTIELDPEILALRREPVVLHFSADPPTKVTLRDPSVDWAYDLGTVGPGGVGGIQLPQ